MRIVPSEVDVSLSVLNMFVNSIMEYGSTSGQNFLWWMQHFFSLLCCQNVFENVLSSAGTVNSFHTRNRQT